jgi:hypothetical protein
MTALVVLLVLGLAGAVAYAIYKQSQPKGQAPNLSTEQKIEAVGGKVLAYAPSVVAGKWVSTQVVSGAKAVQRGATATTNAINKYSTQPIASGLNSAISGIKGIF